MKRYGNLYCRVCSLDNLQAAYRMASRGKGKRPEVRQFAANLDAELAAIQSELLTHSYRTSPYEVFIKYEPKRREIYKLPFRDRVVHWAIMLIIEPIWVRSFTADTYACIKDRGIHGCMDKLNRDLLHDPDGTAYCLKLDVSKFYPTIDHAILKEVIRKKIKDKELLRLLDSIIGSVDSGVPIGNYLSQYFANLYLSELDHLLKEDIKVKYYYRYADDLVILSHSKEVLRSVLLYINHYLTEHRRLSIKSNYQIFPVAARGIDFVGYRFYHTHTLMRKSIKQNMCRKVAILNRKPEMTDAEYKRQLCSWIGWAKHCNSTHLLNSIGMRKFSELKASAGNLTGDKLHIDTIVDKVIHLKGFEVSESKYRGNLLTLQYELYEALLDDERKPVTNPDGTPKMGWVEHITFTGSEALIKQLREIEFDEPVEAKVIKQRIGDKDKYFYKIVDPDAE